MSKMSGSRRRRTWMVLVVLSVVAGRCPAQPYLSLYEGPTYDGTNGYRNPSFNHGASFEPEASWALLNNAGTAAWFADKEPGNVYPPLRWNPLAGPATELATGSSGRAIPYAINAAGTLVGVSNPGGLDQGAARWNAGSASLTILPNLSTGVQASANGINDGGLIIGFSEKRHATTNNNIGKRGVRWDASGNIFELQNLGVDSQGVTLAEAYAINSGGAAVGYARKWTSNNSIGERAVRWDSSGIITELDNLGTDNNGVAEAKAWAINASGDAVGYSLRYDAGIFKGTRAVRWNTGTTSAIELELLGSTNQLGTLSKAYTINDAGTAVGWAAKYVGSSFRGNRAVLWNSTGQATELGSLGTDSGGSSFAEAYDINQAGIAVGTATKYVNSVPQGEKAVYWGTNGVAVDLNTLIAPNAEWKLNQALAISDTGWIAGIGSYDPPGAQGVYDRVFMLQVPIPDSLPGDYNNDSKVNAADYVVWRKNLGTNTTLPHDTTPGSVTDYDYTVWRANFGAALGEAAFVAAIVPEPECDALFVLGALSLVQRIRSRWNHGRIA